MNITDDDIHMLLQVLAPEKQLAIRNKGSLFLACPEPEDLATFKEACMADDPTYKYLGGRSSVKKGIDLAANRKSQIAHQCNQKGLEVQARQTHPCPSIRYKDG
jgi:hypothetical protein